MGKKKLLASTSLRMTEAEESIHALTRRYGLHLLDYFYAEEV